MPFTKHDGVATNPLTVSMSFEMIGDGRQRARQIEIVAVDKAKDIARGLLETFIDGMHLPAIFLADPVGEMLFVLTNDVDAFVVAAAVDDDVLKRLVPLIEHRQDRFFEKLSLIKRGRDDADLWRHKVGADLRVRPGFSTRSGRTRRSAPTTVRTRRSP